MARRFWAIYCLYSPAKVGFWGRLLPDCYIVTNICVMSRNKKTNLCFRVVCLSWQLRLPCACAAVAVWDVTCQRKFQTLHSETSQSGLEDTAHWQDPSRHTHTLRRPFTFHCYLRHSFDHPQGGHGHAGVVGWLANICELQDIAPDGHVVFGREVLGAQHPFDVRHGGTHRHARDIDAAAGHDVIVCGRNGEARRHSTNWKKRKDKVRLRLRLRCFQGITACWRKEHWDASSKDSGADEFTPKWEPCKNNNTVLPMEQRVLELGGKETTFQLTWRDLQQHTQLYATDDHFSDGSRMSNNELAALSYELRK